MSKDKSGSKDRKGKRIPKTIGGVKLPKELRRVGESVLARASSPEGKAMIAGGLSMAAAAIAAAAARDTRPATPPVPPVPPVPPQGVKDPQAMADAVGDAVEAVLARFLGRAR